MTQFCRKPQLRARGLWACLAGPPGTAGSPPSPPQPHLAVGSNDYYISVYSVEKRVR